VPLAQVKKMLSSITVTSGSFRVRSEFTFADRVIGFCLSEPGAQEQLNYIYTGKIVEDTKLLTDKIITPPAKQAIQETITIVDVFNPFTLSEPNYVTGEQWNYVYTGKIVEDTNLLTDKTITALAVKTAESITLVTESPSYTLAETGWCDSNLDYVYTGTGVDTVHVEETLIAATKTAAADTMTLFDTDNSDVVSVSPPEEVTEYPDDGVVLQKTKPAPPREAKTVGDAVIIKRKYKVTDSCAFKDRAFACCLSDAFVAEPGNQLLYAQAREPIAVGSSPAGSTIDVV
jgi:hypothetical protein